MTFFSGARLANPHFNASKPLSKPTSPPPREYGIAFYGSSSVGKDTLTYREHKALGQQIAMSRKQGHPLHLISGGKVGLMGAINQASSTRPINLKISQLAGTNAAR